MNLVIVESPTKARTIGRFLGKDYEIIASMGHLMDLPKSKLGVDTEHDFEPQFELMKDKKKTIAELKSAAKGATSIILATDPDREGEAIAYHVAEILQGSKKTGKIKFKRMVFHEITEEAVKEALNNPREVNTNLVNAQTARRVLDRLVGYKLSPLLWQKVRRGLSAGRVQSVALRLIVEREREIEKFTKEPYYTIHAVVTKQKDTVEFELIEINSGKIESQKAFKLYDGDYTVSKTTIDTEKKAKDIVDDIKEKEFVISDITQKEMRRSPQPPYTTSTLQQDAARRLGFAGRRTMRAAQKLYEEGYITYHRTDSVSLAQSAQGNMRSFIKREFGDRYVPVAPRFYKTKQKLAQEAHEAIRPTKFFGVLHFKDAVTKSTGNDGWRLYELIWRRAIASQMTDALVESTAILADAIGKKDTYRFKANGSVLVFEGFLKVNPQALQDNKLPQFETNEKIKTDDIRSDSHETPPPPRYNDASLIKTLEEKGIGRPSTYATIISVIEDRRYVERADNRFTPTSIGAAVNDFLVKNFGEIDDVPFTADMEDELDKIAEGTEEWVKMMKNFYTPFEKKLGTMKNVERVKIEVEETNEICPECGAPLVIRMGRFGKFFSCSMFPECKFSKPYVEETGLTCPKDNGKVIIKKTRKGRVFYGCSNYPKCDFAAWTRPTSPASKTSESTNKPTNI